MPLQIISVPPKFCYSQKKFYYTYNKNKNISPLKCIFPPQALKPGYGPAVRLGLFILL